MTDIKRSFFGNGSLVWKDCLNELKKQRKIDEYTHSKKLLEQTVQDLSSQFVSDHCFHHKTTIDGEMVICVDCGLVLQESEANDEGDYISHKIKKR